MSQPKPILKEIQFPTTLSLLDQVQKMLHFRDMGQNITDHFKSQQKDTFCQGNLHQDKVFKYKNDQHRDFRGYLELYKKIQDHLQKIQIESDMVCASWEIFKKIHETSFEKF